MYTNSHPTQNLVLEDGEIYITHIDDYVYVRITKKGRTLQVKLTEDDVDALRDAVNQ